MFFTANIMMDFIEWYLRKAITKGLKKSVKVEMKLEKMKATVKRLDRINAALLTKDEG